MPTITVRLDNETRDAVQKHAEEAGLTVSDFVRDLIREAVVSLRAPENRDGYVPETLTPKERHTLSLLHRILGRVLPEDEGDVDGNKAYQIERAEVLEEGLTLEYWTEFAGLRNELGKRDSEQVVDILELFRIAQDSIAYLRQDGTDVSEELTEALRYRGFDFNDALERKMATYVKYMIDDDRWEEQAAFVKGRTRGNSHMLVLDTYLRMLAEYRRIRSRRRTTTGIRDHLLTLDELEAIAAARIHPSNR